MDTILGSRWAVGFDGLLHMYLDTGTYNEEFTSLDAAIKNWFHLKGLSYPIYLTKASEDLIEYFKPKYRIGMTATMHGFYAPQSRELRLKSRYPQLMDVLNRFVYKDVSFSNIEMESSAIYGLSHLLGHRALSFNAIIANRTTGEFSQNPYEAVEGMIGKILEDIKSWQ